MLFKDIDPQILVREIDKFMKTLVTEDERILRDSVSMMYRQSEKGRRINDRMVLKLCNKKLETQLFYSLYSHYLPEDLRALFQEMLIERFKGGQWEFTERRIQLFLSNKGLLLNFILTYQKKWKTSQGFFGWLRKDRQRPRFLFLRGSDDTFLFNPINHSRKRGHRDYGATGPSSPDKYIIRSRELREEMERDVLRQETEDTLAIIEGWIT